MTSLTPLHPPSPHTSSLAKLPLYSETLPTTPFSSEHLRTCPFKIKLSEDPETKLLISYIPGTNAALQAIVKYFPKLTKDTFPVNFIDTSHKETNNTELPALQPP